MLAGSRVQLRHSVSPAGVVLGVSATVACIMLLLH
jgi:hypothetical protein